MKPTETLALSHWVSDILEVFTTNVLTVAVFGLAARTGCPSVAIAPGA
jgi:hypothetical protein